MVVYCEIMPRKGLLIELKSTVFTSSVDDIRVPVNTFKSILYCGATVQYQCGHITEDQYFDRLASDFHHSRDEIVATIKAVRNSLKPNKPVLELLSALKSHFKDQLSIYAVSNLSREDHALIRGIDINWTLFDQIFVSSDVGMQKPELRFYQNILDKIGLPAHQLVVVDDDTDNLLAGLSMGMQGVLSSGAFGFHEISKTLNHDAPMKATGSLKRKAQGTLPCALDLSPKRDAWDVDSVTAGSLFLQRNARDFPSMTHTDVAVKENFAQLLIVEHTGERDLVDIEVHSTTWNYFIGPPVLTQSKFPDDMDTTSLGITILKRPNHVANLVMDKMLQYQTPDGLMQTFFTDFKNRVDPVVCCNILSLFYDYGRGSQLSKTLGWVLQVLEKRAYIHGTSFYPLPEAFFFFLSRLMLRLRTRRARAYRQMRRLLIERVEERLDIPVDPASLAMRLIVCHRLRIRDANGLRRLLAMQLPDGGWDIGTLYHYASKKLRLGNRGTTTALALDAIRHCQHWLDR